MNANTTSQRVPSPSRIAKLLLLAVLAEAAITILHFRHGAWTYGDPSRLHVVTPALVALALVAAATGLFLRHPRKLALAPLVVTTAVPFVGVFTAATATS